MVSKKTTKLIKSLHLKKYRKQTGLFLVEGAKSVLELLQSHVKVRTLIGTEVFLKEHSNIILSLEQDIEICRADQQVLASIGSFKSNSAAIGVAVIPDPSGLVVYPHEYVLVLDDVRDPGNLGTLIRIADWYGIQKIVCSHETTDIYNPKVINASMGSFLRVQLWYKDLKSFLSEVEMPVYGTFLDGNENVHEVNFGQGGIIVLGNESEGIKESLKQYVSQQIYIPRFGRAESLNVAVAAAVICDNVRRQEKKRHIT